MVTKTVEQALVHHNPAPLSGDELLRKHVNTLAVITDSKKITLISKKMYNVMLWIAQCNPNQSIFRARLADIITGIQFNSNHTKLVKSYFRQMLTTMVEWQSPTAAEAGDWDMCAMIAHARQVTERGEVYLEWSYAPNIKDELLDPQRFAKTSFRTMNELNTVASLSLYDICCRYADNPGGVTSRRPWAWWRPVLTGTPESASGAYLEYKIFNRDVLKKAVKKINEVSELDVELIEHKVGRSVKDIQFAVKRKKLNAISKDRQIQPVDLRTIGAAIKAGIAQDRAEKLLLKFGQAAMDNALLLLDARRARATLEPVRNPEKFLTSILQSPQFAFPEKASVQPKLVHDSKAERMKLIEKFNALKRQELHAMFDEMPDADKQIWIERFEEEGMLTSDVVKKSFKSRGLSHPLVGPLFDKFLGNSVWTDGWDKPTDADLLEISISMAQGKDSRPVPRRR